MSAYFSPSLPSLPVKQFGTQPLGPSTSTPRPPASRRRSTSPATLGNLFRSVHVKSPAERATPTTSTRVDTRIAEATTKPTVRNPTVATARLPEAGSSPKPTPARRYPSRKRSARKVLFCDTGSSTETTTPPVESPAKSPRSSRKPVSRLDPLQLRNDRLGTLVHDLSAALRTADSWEAFVNEFRDRPYLSPTVGNVDHPAAELLQHWREHGVPVNSSSPPWTSEQKDECIRRGCHPSANLHAAFLRDEFSDFIENKFWAVLPYELVKDLDIMFSPSAVKDERDRRPRLLCDHSWPWKWISVNESTIPHAPPEAMQFGGALPRLLYLGRHANPKFGVVQTNKNDVKDGFYRMYLAPKDCLKLAVLLPRYEDEPPLVGIPMACTMGWTESPPTFSAMSETICDLANHRFAKDPLNAPSHRLSAECQAQDQIWRCESEPPPREAEASVAEALLSDVPGITPMDPEPDHKAPPSNRCLQRPLNHTDVFVDDFIQLGQGGQRRLNSQRDHLLHAIDEVLDQPRPGETHRNEAASLKKIRQGDAGWCPRKVILGWILDFHRQTIELTPHRKTLLAQIFRQLASAKRVSEKKWRQILGQLRFVAQAIPGSAGLFCALQVALNRVSDGRIRINASLRQHISAFASLAASLGRRPTHFAEIVEQDPSTLGCTDAAKPGMGGIFYDAFDNCYVWRLPFPADIQARLVSTDNPTGDLTNSDLEHAALQGQITLQVASGNYMYGTHMNGTDNTPALSRINKGAISSDGAGAHLCNFACTHQRQHRYCHVGFFIPGEANVMADDASRLQHLTDREFLSHFEQHYPQSTPWQLLHLTSETEQCLISVLRSKSLPRPLQLSTGTNKALSSPSGGTFAGPSATMLPSVLSRHKRTSSATSSSSATGTANAKDPPVTLSKLIPLARPAARWARGSPTWVDSIPARRLMDKTQTIHYSKISSKPSAVTTNPPPEHTRSTSPSSKPCQRPWTSRTPCGEPSTATPTCSPSSPTTGSCDLRNTASPEKRTHARKPSASKTCSSPSAKAARPKPTSPHSHL